MRGDARSDDAGGAGTWHRSAMSQRSAVPGLLLVIYEITFELRPIQTPTA